MMQQHMNEEHFEEVWRYYRDTDYSPRRQTLHTRVSDTYPVLKEIAGNRDLIAYSSLANRVNTDERRYLAVVLGTISRIEDREGRPPLSAVAVKKHGRMPNDEFFRLIEQFEYTPRGETKEARFEAIRDDLVATWR